MSMTETCPKCGVVFWFPLEHRCKPNPPTDRTEPTKET